MAGVRGPPRRGWRHSADYQLRETDSADYVERTEKNVIDSDATLIVAREQELSGGTAFTKICVEKHGRPLLLVCERDGVSQAR